MIDFWTTLSPAQQFWSGAAGSAALIVMVIAAIVCGPDILAAAKSAHRELFDLEDDEQRLAEAKRRAQEELRRQVPHQVTLGEDEDETDARLLAAIARMDQQDQPAAGESTHERHARVLFTAMRRSEETR